MSDFIRREDAVEAIYEALRTPLPNYNNDFFHDSMSIAITMANNISSVEPDRKFLEIIAEYPKVCTYPEYEGKPYYSIKYEENGETIVGFGTYKLEVLSQYLCEYFISSAEPERKKGEWILVESQTVNGRCSVCGYESHLYENDVYGENYCPNCGARLEWK